MDLNNKNEIIFLDIYSDQYDVKGQLEDYGDTVCLNFNFQDLDIRYSQPKPSEELTVWGIESMDIIIGRLKNDPIKAYLHYWHLFKSNDGQIKAHGIVTGRPHARDATQLTTTMVLKSGFDPETEEMILRTLNTEYHCPMNYCDFKMQNEYPELIDNYEELRQKYQVKIKYPELTNYYKELGMNYQSMIEYPEIEHGNILLVLSDFDEYFFHSLCVKDENDKPKPYWGYPHIGMFSDIFRVRTLGQFVDISYFFYHGVINHITFECCNLIPWPLYIENIGIRDIYIDFDRDKILFLSPGKRKEFSEENAEDYESVLTKLRKERKNEQQQML